MTTSMGRLCGIMAAGLLISVAYSAEFPFQDDFSNFATTSKLWKKSNNDSVSATVVNGAYSITNQQGRAGAIVYHTFSVKPASFTASCKITRTSLNVTAGMYICLSIPAAGGAISGYTVNLEPNEFISVMKYSSKGVVQIGGFLNTFLKDGENILGVSRCGNIFYIFSNGQFIGLCRDTDNPLPNGDFALLVPPKSSAIFDDVVVMDSCTTDSIAKCFTDEFNDGLTTGWGLQDGSYRESNGQLAIKGQSENTAYATRTLSLTDSFAARVVVSHRNGVTDQMYGFFINGAPVDGTVPMAMFAITGASLYSAFLAGPATMKDGGTIIKGVEIINPNNPLDTVFYLDTIDVIKKNKSLYTILRVNGVILDSLKNSSINFHMVGAGVFCVGAQQINVEYFHFGETLDICKKDGTRPSARPAYSLVDKQLRPAQADYLYDPMGRVTRSRSGDGGMVRSLSPGFYVAKNRNRAVVVK